MWSAFRSRAPSLLPCSSQCNLRLLSSLIQPFSSAFNDGLLELQEVEKILNDVKADDVKVIPMKEHCDWTDYMVLATGRSAWHVKNIAQALVHKIKEKQRGARRLLLPSIQGQEGGKWIVIDSGKVIVHALDEKAREYYNLEGLWAGEAPKNEQNQDLGSAFKKIRPKNNSKKRVQQSS